jgi:hypothetical protein
LAAGLWIGTNLPTYLESSFLQLIFFLISFGCEIASIIIAVYLIYTIIGLWELELKYIGKITQIVDIFFKNRDESFTDEEFSKQIKGIKAVHFNFEHIKKIKGQFRLHVILLTIGIFAFYVAIILQ